GPWRRRRWTGSQCRCWWRRRWERPGAEEPGAGCFRGGERGNNCPCSPDHGENRAERHYNVTNGGLPLERALTHSVAAVGGWHCESADLRSAPTATAFQRAGTGDVPGAVGGE